jgi:hypothetical protein
MLEADKIIFQIQLQNTHNVVIYLARKQARSSVVEHHLDMVVVGGSIPLVPTTSEVRGQKSVKRCWVGQLFAKPNKTILIFVKYCNKAGIEFLMIFCNNFDYPLPNPPP